MARAWLLGICAILCLVIGAGAIKCRKCHLRTPRDKCEDTCEVSGENSGCMVKSVIRGEHLVRRSMRCYDAELSILCGRTRIQSEGKRHKYQCCSDKNFCSNKL